MVEEPSGPIGRLSGMGLVHGWGQSVDLIQCGVSVQVQSVVLGPDANGPCMASLSLPVTVRLWTDPCVCLILHMGSYHLTFRAPIDLEIWQRGSPTHWMTQLCGLEVERHCAR